MFESVGWVSLPKYSGYAMGYGLETIIGPIEIKHTWSPETKMDIRGLVLDFYFLNLIYININPDICYNEN
jgi:NTE family protein